MRIVVGLEYDGTGFCGWQTQPSGGAVQNALERALAQIAGTHVTTVCAGRTDAGVHAIGQVAHFDVEVKRPLTAWVRGVNALLPASVAVNWAREVPKEFHARYSAVARTYRYLLLNRAERPGLWAGRVGWYHRPLDLDSMRRAARCLIGEQDFSAFRAAECQARSAIKLMHGISIEHAGSLVIFEFCANAFLHNMIRIIVGCLIEVGGGRRQIEWLESLRDGRDRTQAARTADSGGLYLAGVTYDSRWNLPSAPNALGASSGDLGPVLSPCR